MQKIVPYGILRTSYESLGQIEVVRYYFKKQRNVKNYFILFQAQLPYNISNWSSLSKNNQYEGMDLVRFFQIVMEIDQQTQKLEAFIIVQ